MSILAVAGGTGVAGSTVVREALARGFSVRSLSRRLPQPSAALDGVDYVAADATTGEGLAAALDGAEILVDALEDRSFRAQKLFPEAGRRLLLLAGAESGSGKRLRNHHFCAMADGVEVHPSRSVLTLHASRTP